MSERAAGEKYTNSTSGNVKNIVYREGVDILIYAFARLGGLSEVGGLSYRINFGLGIKIGR